MPRLAQCTVCGVEFLPDQTTTDTRCPGCRALDALTRCTGTVRWFDRRKRYGFVRTADGRDVFCHMQDLRLPLRQFRRGVTVALLVEHTERGLQGRQIRLAAPDVS